MKLNELSALKGTKSAKRVGRGIGSGKGKTAGRGHKGQKSRSGVSLLGFIGGPLQIWRTIPKRGFKNGRFATKAKSVNVGFIQQLIDAKKLKSTITLADFQKLFDLKKNVTVRILSKGDLKTAVTLEAHHVSKTAEEIIKKAGGSIKIIPQAVRGPKTGKTSKSAKK